MANSLTKEKMKLWSKGFEINKEIERFTVGRDREMDLYLAKPAS